jgi:hypothetical protein
MTEVISKRILPFALLAVYTLLSLGTITQKSATWDETHYLGVGYHLLKNRQWDIPSSMLHPPLSYYLHSLPLLFTDLEPSCFNEGRSSDILSGVRRGQCLMKTSDPSGDTLLNLARLPMIGVGILLGWFVYVWASSLYGTGGGLLSLFLYCLSPNILAHSGLITADLCLSTFGFLTVYLFWQNTRSPSVVRIITGGVALGLTLTSKYAGVIWIPLLVVLAVLERLRSRSFLGGGKGFLGKGPVLHAGAVLVCALFVLSLSYQFDLTPYISGIESQRRMIGEGFPAFLNGEVSKKGGWWYYYLFAFLIKEPIPSQILFVVGLFMAVRGFHQSGSLWLLAPVAMILISFSFLTQVNVGLRYLLPAFPFLIVLSGKAVGWFCGKTWRAVVLGCLVLWYAGETAWVYPHYLSYFNSLAGGPKGGYRYLVDSNLDWGQDLKGLKKYMDSKNIEEIKLSYFGTADPEWYGIRYQPLPSFILPGRGSSDANLHQGDLVAVSPTNLYPLYVDLGPLSEYLRRLTPIDQVGSILIYRMERKIHVGS